MNILVTGGAGFVGTNLIKKLISEGHQVTSLDDYESGSADNHIGGCMYLVFDIDKIDWFKDEYDVVFHMAALSRIQPSFDNPSETFRVNTDGCMKVAEWARKTNTKVVYAGSSSRWHNPFISPYACFKHLGEEIFKMYKEVYGLDVEICRFYNAYGPHEIVDGDWAAVIGKWRRQVRDEQPITIVGDGNQRRDFTHIDDIIEALYKIGIEDHKHEDAWELGTGHNYSINEVAKMFQDKFGCPLKYVTDQHGNYRETLRENDDALDVLGWEPKDRLKEYIQSL